MVRGGIKNSIKINDKAKTKLAGLQKGKQNKKTEWFKTNGKEGDKINDNFAHSIKRFLGNFWKKYTVLPIYVYLLKEDFTQNG